MTVRRAKPAAFIRGTRLWWTRQIIWVIAALVVALAVWLILT